MLQRALPKVIRCSTSLRISTLHMVYSGPRVSGVGGGSLSGSSQVNHSDAGEEMSSLEFLKCGILSGHLNLEEAWRECASVQPCGRLCSGQLSNVGGRQALFVLRSVTKCQGEGIRVSAKTTPKPSTQLHSYGITFSVFSYHKAPISQMFESSCCIELGFYATVIFWEIKKGPLSLSVVN